MAKITYTVVGSQNEPLVVGSLRIIRDGVRRPVTVEEDSEDDVRLARAVKLGLISIVGTTGIETNPYPVSGDGAQFNSLVRTYPAMVAAPYTHSSAAAYSSVNADAGGAVSADADYVCPITARPAAKVRLVSGQTTSQATYFTYYSVGTYDYGPDGVWMLPVFVPFGAHVGLLQVRLYTTSSTSSMGAPRTFTWNGSTLAAGWNILTCLNAETRIDPAGTTYGVVGTNGHATAAAWGDTNGTSSMPVRSVQVHVLPWTTPLSADIDVRIGALMYGQPGWARACVMWSADDVPQSFIDLAQPVIESYGWKCTYNVVAGYANGAASNYLRRSAIDAVRASGHEIWGHNYLHENSVTDPAKASAEARAARYWRETGILSAARAMAWPFGAVDQAAQDRAVAAGYRYIANTWGWGNSPVAPSCNLLGISRFQAENTNSWATDSMLCGSIKRGTSFVPYLHNPVLGGAGINTGPGSSQFYVDHLRRWCDLVKAEEQAGNVVCDTIGGYFRRVGFDFDSY